MWRTARYNVTGHATTFGRLANRKHRLASVHPTIREQLSPREMPFAATSHAHRFHESQRLLKRAQAPRWEASENHSTLREARRCSRPESGRECADVQTPLPRPRRGLLARVFESWGVLRAARRRIIEKAYGAALGRASERCAGPRPCVIFFFLEAEWLSWLGVQGYEGRGVWKRLEYEPLPWRIALRVANTCMQMDSSLLLIS